MVSTRRTKTSRTKAPSIEDHSPDPRMEDSDDEAPEQVSGSAAKEEAERRAEADKAALQGVRKKRRRVRKGKPPAQEAGVEGEDAAAAVDAGDASEAMKLPLEFLQAVKKGTERHRAEAAAAAAAEAADHEAQASVRAAEDMRIARRRERKRRLQPQERSGNLRLVVLREDGSGGGGGGAGLRKGAANAAKVFLLNQGNRHARVSHATLMVKKRLGPSPNLLA